MTIEFTFQKFRLHYNYDNTNNELGNPTGIYKAIRNKSSNMDLYVINI
jgi:hypothetical protein